MESHDATAIAAAEAPDILRPAGEVLREAALDTACLRRGGQRLWSLFTGFRALDSLTGGLKPGELTVVSAPPGAGKSSLARGVAERVAVDQRQPTLFFSLEMPADVVLTLMACSRARVEARTWQEAGVNAAERLQVLQTTDRIERSPLFVDDKADLAIAQIRDRALCAHGRNHGLELVVVDGLMLVQSGVADRAEEVAFVAGQLKALALQLSIPVLATATLAGELLGAVEEAADVVLRIEPAASDLRAVVVAKNRTGPTGEVRLAFRPAWTRFQNPDEKARS